MSKNRALPGYISLLEWTDRLSRRTEDLIATDVATLLSDIRGSPDCWLGSVLGIEQAFGTAVSNPMSLREHAQATGSDWMRGA